ncbi:hypothetical protein FTO74_03925 [Granulicella sp. WH15]|uniref:hypothetical protein n=1 Tax=Granulicella sp. WH15 TaxID=2602070 RepID=UPI001366EC40|nr:hypothetical protein [Granulicella sp. WH15]QHN02613.1 hypothetical protein FTO74_03925 [Granulicella sp. WH15]
MPRIAFLLVCCCIFCTACKKDAAVHRSTPPKEAVAASPKPHSAIDLPPPIESIISSYADECKQIGGTLNGEVRVPEITTTDLDADGRPDYILNPKNLQCSESASLFCPNAGCDFRIAVSGNAYRDALSVAGGEAKITEGTHGKVVEILVQSFHCKGAKRTDQCVDSIAWSNHTLNEEFRIRH